MPFAFPKPISRAQERKQEKARETRRVERVRRYVFKRDSARCRACGLRESAHVHHLKFRSQGGKYETRNLVTLCAMCHADLHGYRLTIIGENADRELRFVRRKAGERP